MFEYGQLCRDDPGHGRGDSPADAANVAFAHRSRLMSHAPELMIEVEAYFVALDSIYEIGHRLKMTLS